MPANSKIEWTDGTWNPVTGCTKVSPGCAHCYAETITLRFKRGGPFLPGKSTIKLHPDRLRLPISWKAPRRIFVNSMRRDTAARRQASARETVSRARETAARRTESQRAPQEASPPGATTPFAPRCPTAISAGQAAAWRTAASSPVTPSAPCHPERSEGSRPSASRAVAPDPRSRR